MERFKWFDFLGALFLLFSVTKTALTPQEVMGDLNSTIAPSIPVGQKADPFQTSEGNSGLEIEVLNPSVKMFLEGDSKRLSIQDGLVGEENSDDHPFLDQALNPSFALGLEGIRDDLNPPFDSGFVQTHSSTTAPVFIW